MFHNAVKSLPPMTTSMLCRVVLLVCRHDAVKMFKIASLPCKKHDSYHMFLLNLNIYIYVIMYNHIYIYIYKLFLLNLCIYIYMDSVRYQLLSHSASAKQKTMVDADPSIYMYCMCAVCM